MPPTPTPRDLAQDIRPIYRSLRNDPGPVSRDIIKSHPDILRQLREISTVPQFRTQQGIALALGVTQGFISFCERGLSAPSPPVAKKWLMLLVHHADLSRLSAENAAAIEAVAAAIPWNMLELQRFHGSKPYDTVSIYLTPPDGWNIKKSRGGNSGNRGED